MSQYMDNAEAYDVEYVKHSHHDKKEEAGIVSFANTCSKPDAMMIKT